MTLSGHLKTICSLKPFLPQNTLITEVHDFVTFHTDYSNSLLFGIADYNTNLLERIQNGAARAVTEDRNCGHVKIILHKWHRLSVKEHDYFKILLILYKYI